ncbi:Eukaryotic aspartyl protease family protein [Rhynchospora pubera]|uniref:Eukaryotic aspartyl protease family protein n=1 Tax=Rhynchospora pubera TaxID=906938 RepID=A0AAV8CZ77_9POAL|nr:Eukaryotic aspartyl protease family protein [Rhynchospora pubera]
MLSYQLFLLARIILCLLQSHQSLSLQSNTFLLPLSHTLSSTNSSLHHLLKSSSLRSSTRHGRRHGTHRRPPLSLPLSSGSDYTLSLSVGPSSSPTTVSLFMDTGSDLVWFPCSPFECILCEGKSNPNSNSTISPPPADSHLVSCASLACSAAHSSQPSSDLCAAAKCPLDAIETSSCSSHACPPLYYAYGDGSLLAHLRHGRLSLSSSKPNSLSVSNFTFACAHSTLAEPVGVAGFGRGPLSLPAQLSALSPSLSSRFSYCLVSHSFRTDRLLHPSPLILGRSPEVSSIGPTESAFVYTPLLHNPKHPYFYSVALEAISVGPTKILARPDLASIDHAGNGGMVVDSGTTFTMLPEETFSQVSTEFDRHMSSAGFSRAKETEAKTGLSPLAKPAQGPQWAWPTLLFEFFNTNSYLGSQLK